MKQPSTEWRERIAPDEAAHLARVAEVIAGLQRARSAKFGPGRALHRKQLLAARFETAVQLGNERDPIIGGQDGTLEFKIPKRPIRKKIVGLPAFTTVRGGAYFFLPGLRALGYLASLDEPGRA